jgi:hypothetical protein
VANYVSRIREQQVEQARSVPALSIDTAEVRRLVRGVARDRVRRPALFSGIPTSVIPRELRDN